MSPGARFRSFDETLERMEAYAATGVDGLFVASPMTLEELEETARHLRPLGKPLLCLLSRSDRTPFISVKEAFAMGYSFMIAPIESLFAMHKAVMEVYRRFLGEGALDTMAEKLTTIEEFNNFIGAGEALARQRRYGR